MNPTVRHGWSAEQLQRVDTAVELDIAVRRPDDTLGRWTTVWVVCIDDGVFVRTWYRRDTGWFGDAVRSGQARVRVPGLEADVAVVDLGGAAEGAGTTAEGLRGKFFDDVDAAYRTKYGAFGDETVGAMVAARARATTLRLDRL